jgi:5-methylcytosine-specific restriction protein A
MEDGSVMRIPDARTREAIAYDDWLARCRRKRRVNPRFRRIVIERARGRCTYCGRRVKPENFVIDHIHPVCAGGRSVLQNLAACCWECNTAKGAEDGRPPYGTSWMVFILDDIAEETGISCDYAVTPC